jgi:hypothetical protein
MRHYSLLTAGLAALAAGSAVQAQGSSADKRLALTIYNSDLALVEHVRPLTLAYGSVPCASPEAHPK